MAKSGVANESGLNEKPQNKKVNVLSKTSRLFETCKNKFLPIIWLQMFPVSV